MSQNLGGATGIMRNKVHEDLNRGPVEKARSARYNSDGTRPPARGGVRA